MTYPVTALVLATVDILYSSTYEPHTIMSLLKTTIVETWLSGYRLTKNSITYPEFSSGCQVTSQLTISIVVWNQVRARYSWCTCHAFQTARLASYTGAPKWREDELCLILTPSKIRAKLQQGALIIGKQIQ